MNSRSEIFREFIAYATKEAREAREQRRSQSGLERGIGRVREWELKKLLATMRNKVRDGRLDTAAKPSTTTRIVEVPLPFPEVGLPADF